MKESWRNNFLKNKKMINNFNKNKIKQEKEKQEKILIVAKSKWNQKPVKKNKKKTQKE